uniref:NADH-ubiquinone oxidoreductase chain 4L n=1 Tax=Anisolabididae sp. NS-2016 TaxID=1914569 RepID=A0A1J0M4D5_9NEOP|nr:NADH dehydrogenase subunit 4L [Anisolabididae sp. NS-2016]
MNSIMFSIMIMMIMIITGLFSIAAKRNHILAVLLSLEMMILAMFTLLVYLMNYLSMDFMFIMTFLTLAVCEGSLGLSILVSIVRKYGDDNFQNLNLI